jgi:hypothetical protein
MAQSTTPAEPHISPPPIPIRSQLRNGPAYQQRLRAINLEPKISISAPSSPASQILVKKLDRELTESQHRLVSAILEGKNMSGNRQGMCWDDWREKDIATERGHKKQSGPFEDRSFSEVGSEVSCSDDHLEPLQSGESSGDFLKQIEVQEHVPAQRGSRGGPSSAPHTNHTSCSDLSSPSSDYSLEDMDTKVSDWLAQGSLNSESHEPGSLRHVTSNSSRPFPPRLATLSLFPPTSPSTGNKEYTPPGTPFARPVCPMSPLNNGRDVYGNYIPSNKRDYFTAQSPPTSPSMQGVPESRISPEQGRSSPIVRLRGGGWNLKGLWKTYDTGGPDQSPVSTSAQHSISKDAFAWEVPMINHARRAESRAPRTVRSHSSTTRAVSDNGKAHGMIGQPSPLDARNDGQFPVEESDIRPGSNTPDSADTDDSSVRRARADAVLYQHFGPQLSPPVPISPGTWPLTVREHPTNYGRVDVPVRGGPRSPPVDGTFAPLGSRSAGSHQNHHTNESIDRSQPLSEIKSILWNTVRSQDTRETDDTTQSYVVSPRDKKRWNRSDPPPPPRLPPPNPPRYLRTNPPEDDASEYSDDDSYRAASTISANTTVDQLIDRLHLKNTGVYRRVEREREARRILANRQWHEEADRKSSADSRRLEETGQRELDLSTIVPDDSITAVVRRQQQEILHDLEHVPADDKYRPTTSPAPSQYLPRYGPIKVTSQVIPQNQSDKFHMIGHPSIIPATAVIEPKSIKRNHSLQTVLSKAGKLTRLILAAPSDSKYKTYSQGDPQLKNNTNKQSGMSADASGWPRSNKAFPSATHGMFLSAQTPRSRTMFSRDRPQTAVDDMKRSDGWSWEPPRGRRVKKVGKVESKRRGGRRWRKTLNEDNSVGDTQVMDLASRDVHERKSRKTTAPNTNTHTARSEGATPLQHPGYVRSEPRVRSPPTGILGKLAGSSVNPDLLSSPHYQSEHTFTPSDAADTSQAESGIPNSYVRRGGEELLPVNPALGYPYQGRLNTYHALKPADAATMTWLEGIRTQTDAIPDAVINVRGGDSTSPELYSTDGEASSLASHYRLLTSVPTSMNSGDETIDGTDIDTLLLSCTHLHLGEVTHEAIATVNGAQEGDIRPSIDETNIRSSFSTDSTIELRREKRVKESVWRSEDQARAMALHSLR